MRNNEINTGGLDGFAAEIANIVIPARYTAVNIRIVCHPTTAR
jgi:hypothetical protein